MAAENVLEALGMQLVEGLQRAPAVHHGVVAAPRKARQHLRAIPFRFGKAGPHCLLGVGEDPGRTSYLVFGGEGDTDSVLKHF